MTRAAGYRCSVTMAAGIAVPHQTAAAAATVLLAAKCQTAALQHCRLAHTQLQPRTDVLLASAAEVEADALLACGSLDSRTEESEI